MKKLCLGLVVSAVVMLAGAAHAQNPGNEGIDCVYEELIDSYELVAENFLYGDLGTSGAAEAAEALNKAKASCAAKYSYSGGQLEAVGDLGILASSLDYLSEELFFSGVSEEAVGGIMDAYDTFSDEDVDALFDADWRADAAFHDRLKARMLTAGIPDEAELMDIALSMLEIAALAEETTYLFMFDDVVP